MKIYLAGCGQIGKKLGEKIHNDHEVIGLKRTDADLNFRVLPTDLGDKEMVEKFSTDAEIIIFTVTPSIYSEAGYRHVYEHILGNVIDWANRHDSPPLVILVSSTGVYGQQNGEWVDEDSETKPTRASSQWIIFGEEQLRQRLEKNITVRFSGIYGETRTRLIENATRREPIQKNPPLWTNRIHENDCVDFLAFLIERYQHGDALDNIYLASDDTPVSQYDVSDFICKELGQDSPPIKTENLSKACNKRCNNSRLKTLGYTFKYPNYRLGYAHIMRKK